jgi:RHS repeat-associated protein
MSGGNNSRLTTMSYPTGGRSITYNYATGVDDRISRLTSISDGATTLESLSYLGLSTVVIRSYPQPGTELTYVKLSGESNGDAGDQYTGLDRFGRVVDQRWIVTATGTTLDRCQHGYDRDGNVLYSNNLVNSSFSELYHANGSGNDYDNLNQLTNFARGTLNQTNDTISSPTHSIAYSFDALGNWTSTFTDNTTTQTRTANQQNEITSISGQTTPGYDGNGNTTTDQNGNTLVYDAWNRLVAYKNGSTVLTAYSYDALNRRITENPGSLRDLYYDFAWQLLEEDVSGSMADQYVWSSVYIDALIERDTPTLRIYVQQNANYDVTSLVDTSGNVQERYISDPYGSFTILTASWTTRGTSSYGWVVFHQGGRYDFATGLFAFRERDYSPTLGRWMENDPIGSKGRDMNFYNYLGDSPNNASDPLGLQDQPKPKPTPKPPVGENEYGQIFFSSRPTNDDGPQGMNVQITFKPTAKACCKEIAFIQVSRIVIFEAAPPFKPGDIPPGGGHDWQLDVRPPKGTKPGSGSGWYGYELYPLPIVGGFVEAPLGPLFAVPGTPGQKPFPYAGMQDVPRPGAWNRLQEFITCAVCKSGQDVGKIYGCVTWGQQITNTGEWSRIKPTYIAKPPNDSPFYSAIQDWNKKPNCNPLPPPK